MSKANRHLMPRWMYLIKAGFHRCHYCNCKGAKTIDHVVPQSKGGPTTEANCVPACVGCNNFRGDRDYFYFKNGGWKQRFSAE